MSFENLFAKIWKDYTERNPHAQQIQQLFIQEGEPIVNDHIGFRTFNLPKVSIEQLAKFFIAYGYAEKGTYNFPTKKVTAKHYEHPDPLAPKVFISELLIEQFSPRLQSIIKNSVGKIPSDAVEVEEFLIGGTFWQPLSYKMYQELLSESEYAAWIYTFGFCTNHFTLYVNALHKYKTISEVNHFVASHQIELSAAGGLIKGTPKEHLVQSSTLATKIEVAFEEGNFQIPACYYGFAQRYPLSNGQLYTGFVATSTDKMFESTDAMNR